MSEIIDRMALALFNCTAEEWAAKSEDFRKTATGDIRRMVAAIREPTMAQLAAAQTAWLADPEKRSSTIYRAMIDVALILD